MARRELGLPSSSSKSPLADAEDASLLWVDKYRPRCLKSVIGQQGDQSCASKLLRWLQNWHRHHAGGASKPAGRKTVEQPTPWFPLFCISLEMCVPAAARFGKFGGAKDDGSGYKAALLSGPPGVGKTTTAALVCEVSVNTPGLIFLPCHLLKMSLS